MSDPAKYRSREEVSEVREKRDPIEHFGKKLLDGGVVTDEDLKAIDRDIKARVVAAAEFATESPEPGAEELYTDVYA
jgi:pyruvate dehydrogenase E1 component alpha subunit